MKKIFKIKVFNKKINSKETFYCKCRTYLGAYKAIRSNQPYSQVLSIAPVESNVKKLSLVLTS